jgi:DNA polymerase elongation subunit (family B)
MCRCRLPPGRSGLKGKKMIPKFFCVIDIETIPNQELPPECLPQFDESTVKLGNLQDRFKIQAKIDEARIAWEAQQDKRCSVDPDLCMVCCGVAVAFQDCNGGIPNVSCRSAVTTAQEAQLICEIWNCIREAYKADVPIVGFNTMSFDLPVLIRRAMLLDVGVSPAMIHALMARQESNRRHYDLMQLLGVRSPFSGKIEAKSLSYYLKLFGLGGKTRGMDGSQIYGLWQEGKHEEIKDYCQTDVHRTASLFRRVAPWLISPSDAPSGIPRKQMPDSERENYASETRSN